MSKVLGVVSVSLLFTSLAMRGDWLAVLQALLIALVVGVSVSMYYIEKEIEFKEELIKRLKRMNESVVKLKEQAKGLKRKSDEVQ